MKNMTATTKQEQYDLLIEELFNKIIDEMPKELWFKGKKRKGIILTIKREK